MGREQYANTYEKAETSFRDLREQAIARSHAEVERRLGCKISEATALDRVSITTEILNEYADQEDLNNADRFYVEAVAGLRKLAELELDFQMAKQKLSALYQ